jgi:hypothetical protein
MKVYCVVPKYCYNSWIQPCDWFLSRTCTLPCFHLTSLVKCSSTVLIIFSTNEVLGHLRSILPSIFPSIILLNSSSSCLDMWPILFHRFVLMIFILSTFIYFTKYTFVGTVFCPTHLFINSIFILSLYTVLLSRIPCFFWLFNNTCWLYIFIRCIYQIMTHYDHIIFFKMLISMMYQFHK